MRKWFLAFCGVAILSAMLPFSAIASAAAVKKYVPEAAVVGEGKFRYLFMHIYDIRLFAPQGVYDADKPFALRLTYQRDLDGSDIAEESIRQMRKQGWKDEQKLSAWGASMQGIFPNVAKGTVLTGIRLADGSTVFLHDGVHIGHVEDPSFTDAFFGIWLSPQTTEPSLRKALLGEAS